MKQYMHRFGWLMVFVVLACLSACSTSGDTQDDVVSDQSGVKIDPQTGIPYAITFQYPIDGFDSSDFGFGFGSENTRFCLEYKSGACMSYGYHLARDTSVAKTPYQTPVVAPADGIVRLTTNATYGGYGSDTQANLQYKGCLILLEHEFANGQRVTTLLGHVMCESQTTYDAVAHTGNPAVGEIVQRGQYLGHVNHYWAGSGQDNDWHHLHWGMRKGSFQANNVGPFIKGYAKKGDFTVDSATGVWTHPDWLDPFVVVIANGDPAAQASANVRHHPSGSLLEDEQGMFWYVSKETEIAHVPAAVMTSDRYNTSRAIRVSSEEINCYAKVPDLVSVGPVVLYQRPGMSTVVMAYKNTQTRYDVIRWEALLSWGFGAVDVSQNLAVATFYETNYFSKGYRLLRPGTLVKADEEAEVAIITAEQTRRPIISGEAFEEAGFQWEHVVSIPASVLTAVAGPRENVMIDLPSLHACAVLPDCPGGGANCGGGGVPDDSENPPEGSDNDPNQESLVPVGKVRFQYEGQPVAGMNQFQGMWDPPGESFYDWVPSTFALCQDALSDDGKLDCLLDMPSGSVNFLFTVQLPDGRWWGDESCAATGGCGQTIGTVTLTGPNGSIPFQLVSNGQGSEYKNGFVSMVP